VLFRSAGGSYDLANLTTLCAAHHQRGVHPDPRPGAGPARLRDASWALPLGGSSRNGYPPGAVRLASGLLAIALVVPAASAEPETLTLDVLLHHMASTRGVVAEFREVKTLALLAEPLESRGTLYFQPPDRFVRTTHEPAMTRLALVGARMQFEDATGTSQLDLADDPVARQFAANLMALWQGDRARLEALYRLEFAAEEARWTLALVPRKPPLDRFIERIRLAGDGATMREMELLEVDGDRTLTTFEKSEVDHAFEPEEAQRVFGVK
jgi:hypothetical protein